MFDFSYRQEIYDEKKEPERRFLKWKNKDKTWPYKNCQVSVIGMKENKARIVVRRKHSEHSSFKGDTFEANLMFGFVASGATKKETSLTFDVIQNQDKHYGKIEDKHREIYDVTITGDKNDLDKLYKTIDDSFGNPPAELQYFHVTLTQNQNSCQ